MLHLQFQLQLILVPVEQQQFQLHSQQVLLEIRSTLMFNGQQTNQIGLA